MQPIAPYRGTSSPQLRPHVLGGTSVEALGDYITNNDVHNILVLIGAGASVAAGIPDFRSPSTGLYANLSKYKLHEPSDAFSISLLRESPRIFYSIAKDMNLWPGAYQPTAVHHFVKLLSDQGRLLRCCTQNIDGLERAAGVPEDLLVEAHGSFCTASCIDCHHPFDIQRNREEAYQGSISLCDECGAIVKPDVVFFGESLPERFFSVLTEDTKKAELVIVIGTSLQVRPFAVLPLHVGLHVPRVLINMERVGGRMFQFPEDDVTELATHLAASSSESSEENEDSDNDAADAFVPPHDEVRVHTATHAAHGEERSRIEAARRANEESADQSRASSVALEHHLHQEALDLSPAGSDVNSSSSSSSSDGFLEYAEFAAHYQRPEMYRDVFFRGDCQQAVRQLADALGCGDNLRAAVSAAAAAQSPGLVNAPPSS